MNINLCVERLRVPFIASDACQGDVVFFNERELFRANYTRLSTTIWCFRESTRGQRFRSLSGANFCSIPSSFSPFSFFFNLSRVIEETTLQHDSMFWSTACRRVDIVCPSRSKWPSRVLITLIGILFLFFLWITLLFPSLLHFGIFKKAISRFSSFLSSSKSKNERRERKNEGKKELKGEKKRASVSGITSLPSTFN